MPRPGFGGHSDLVTDAFAQPAVIHPDGLLLGHLGLSEPHHLGHTEQPPRPLIFSSAEIRSILVAASATVPGGQPAEHRPRFLEAPQHRIPGGLVEPQVVLDRGSGHARDATHHHQTKSL